jgi:hypothetical protein
MEHIAGASKIWMAEVMPPNSTNFTSRLLNPMTSDDQPTILPTTGVNAAWPGRLAVRGVGRGSSTARRGWANGTGVSA